MPRSGEATRERLLDAAEALYAARGVDAVSLAEINLAAGQRNTAAVHYHFGGREGLVEAVLERHLAAIDDRRLGLLEGLGEDPSLRDLARILVEPLAACLDDASGRSFLRIQAQLAPHRKRPTRAARHLVERVSARLCERVPASVERERGALVQLLLFPALAERARQERRGGASTRPLFVASLVDAITAILEAPVSPAAAALAETAERAR